MIDSHCHLSSLENLEQALSRAEEANVEKILTIGTSFQDFEDNLSIASAHKNVFLAVGIHPEYADDNLEFNEEALIKYLNLSKTVALGEIGLDYFYDTSSKENQLLLFKKQLDIAAKLNLPVIIHTRNADADTIRLLNEYKGRLTGVLHCFSSSLELCRFALEIGFYISASGIITFKKSDTLREIFKTVPLDRLLIETDAPYLAPHPLRGKKNEPSFIYHTLKCLAEIKETDIAELEKITSSNFHTLFKKVPS